MTARSKWVRDGTIIGASGVQIDIRLGRGYANWATVKGDRDAPTEKNATLIMATPDLLAACKAAELVMTIVLPRSHMAEYTEALAIVRAAIAKATA